MNGSIRVLAAAAVLATGTAAPLPMIGAAPAVAQASTCYRTFWPSGREVEIEACEYNQGTSGFTILRNTSRRDMHVCWTFHYGNGREFKGCNFRIRAGEEARSSCSSCNRRNGGGLTRVTWRTVKPST
ncbi:hypothetical protein FPZ54_17555 [Sphingomonas suaedae]|uniref:Beta/gamma crystallin 'Greek key' domain-containing protein n=1 Tax=Sphingomonas suaedae TaxID=2599297 RepID=A0A518RJK7_9SPHN|nr:hypothetical protein [Sphingomonas suaedae]QDX27635.1 hypothetical protein FPZ54_17555 [Sphingomonas suaedae]